MNRISVFTFTLLVLVGLGTMVALPLAAERSKNQESGNDPWFELQQRTPYPYIIPLADDIPTVVDGVYVKLETKATPPIPCRRCPDYKPEGGFWKLSLRRGVYRIFYEPGGWKSIGTFLIIGDRILLVNDPVCPALTGVYRWRLKDGNFIFSTVEDRCSAGLRAQNFSNLPWQSCIPPSIEAAGSDHRPKPDGCNQQ